ncbi:MAG TPA: TlpA disulfide reductase family protein [Candidatus Thermoplasmatota archaeon]|nr:TlpA disulfide reductase family protein [Candidatus Thermoplasmatota archaeon]
MRARLLLALLVAALASGCLSGPLTGEPVPRFEVVTSDGQLVNETTYLGRFVILDLMATWCGPCKLEVAHLREVQERHPDVVILSIGVDPQETIVEHDAFREKYGATWPYAIDRDGKVKQAMGMRIIPKLVIIDPEGVVVLEREGEVLPAAMTRVIDPASAPPAGATWLAAALALLAGLFAPLNPYRRLHRDAGTGGPTLAALGALAALGILAWPFAGLASTRATYGSLFLGLITVGAALWWLRARRKAREPQPGSAVQAASDRAYEMAPHFAAAVVLALGGAGAGGFFAPLFAFFVGAFGGFWARPRLPHAQAEAAGVAGLALVGLGLLAFGARVLLV